MIYVVFFSNGGVPATGLSPAIGLYKKVSDGTDVTPEPTVSEVGGGFYKFTAFPAEALVVQVNGGAGLANGDRYKVMQITPHDADLDAQVSTRAPESGGTWRPSRPRPTTCRRPRRLRATSRGTWPTPWPRMTRPPGMR
ncbi:MAG: hypothetical protein WC443_11800, partial [Desulfobaccales bacterium]